MANLAFPQQNIINHGINAQAKNPLVSIVIPTYNRAGLVARAVHSVLLQSYDDFEVIIVDDASTDNTPDLINALQGTDPRIRYIRHEINRGAQVARNTGIHAARGKYVAFLDSDNEWFPEKLHKQMELFSNTDNALGAVYCAYHKVSDAGNILNAYIPRYRGSVYKQALAEWITDTSTLVVRKDVLEKIHGFNEDIRTYQEWELCIRLARGCEFDFVPECLSLYHDHTSPSISKDFLTDAHGYLTVVEKYHREILRECGRRTLSEHYLRAGRLFIHAERVDLARACFMKSIRYDPLNIIAMIHFTASLLGKDIYQFLRSYKQDKFPVAEI